MHFYDYETDGWDAKSYPTGAKFVSEYGWQSFPSFEVLEPYSVKDDRYIFSAWMDFRQRHPGGNRELLRQIQSHFDYSVETTENNFKRFLYLTQIHQAVSIKTETEVYRRGMREREGAGTNTWMTMGALYWQLNDIWPGASWSSIEYGGTQKDTRVVAFRPATMIALFL